MSRSCQQQRYQEFTPHLLASWLPSPLRDVRPRQIISATIYNINSRREYSAASRTKSMLLDPPGDGSQKPPIPQDYRHHRIHIVQHLSPQGVSLRDKPSYLRKRYLYHDRNQDRRSQSQRGLRLERLTRTPKSWVSNDG